MGYVEIKDFKNGLDTRRPAIVGEPGTLQACINAHITRGGDVENAKKFVSSITLPAGTFGWHAGNNKAYVFGSGSAPTNLPGIVVYQQLAHPSGADMTALLWSENFNGKVYTIAEYADGSVYVFFDGTRVSDWDTKAAAIADNSTVATYLCDKIDALAPFIATVSGTDITITAATAGTAFTRSVGNTGTGSLTLTSVQANQAAVAEVRATASFTVTGGFAEASNTISAITAGVTALISSPVAYVLNNTATALACVIAINNGTDTHGYSASPSGATVTITGPAGEGATANGRVLGVTANAFVTVGSVNNFSGGVTAVAAKPQIDKVAVGGTFAASNTYTVTLNGTAYKITGLSSGMPRAAKTFKSKMHNAVRGLCIFSAIDDPTMVTSGTGIGSINVSSQDEGSQRLTGFGVYTNSFAMFTNNTIQIWDIDSDPANNSFRQLLPNTGTRSPKSIMGYGSTDLLYLSDNGNRSMRARDSSNAAFADDIGTRIDSDVISFLATLTDSEIQNAISINDPTDGRAWIATKNRIYVFSYFPGSRVSAWSYYSPGFTIDGLAVVNKRIYARSGNTVYLYGGSDNNTYPSEGEIEVTVLLPFIDAGRIAGGKQLEGVDVLVEGEWTVELLTDPRDLNAKTAAIIVNNPTPMDYRIPLDANTSHFAPKLTSTKGGRVVLSSVVVHFDDTETQ